MKKDKLKSDQFYKWSESNERAINKRTKEKTRHLYQQTENDRVQCSPWVVDRALQTMWQTRMQVCKRTWSWTKVLSFCQHPWEASRNDLYPLRNEGKSGSFFINTSLYSPITRRNRKYKSRINQAERNILDDRINALTSSTNRRFSNFKYYCQHAVLCQKNCFFNHNTKGGR